MVFQHSNKAAVNSVLQSVPKLDPQSNKSDFDFLPSKHFYNEHSPTCPHLEKHTGVDVTNVIIPGDVSIFVRHMGKLFMVNLKSGCQGLTIFLPKKSTCNLKSQNISQVSLLSFLVSNVYRAILGCGMFIEQY